MSLRCRVERLAMMVDQNAETRSDESKQLAELLDLATVPELRRLRDLLEAIDRRMPVGTPVKDYLRYATEAEHCELQALESTLKTRREVRSA